MNYFSKVRTFLEENKTIVSIFCLYLIFSIFHYNFIKAPNNVIVNSYFKIEKGQHLSQIALNLKNEGIIKSTEAFKIFTIFLGGDKKIIAGDYLILGGESSYRIAKRIISGSYQSVSIKVTVPEGTSNKEIADILYKKLYNFDKKAFLEKTKDMEGFLFPDTYFFGPKADLDEIVLKMTSNFDRKISEFQKQIETSKKSTKEIITMASILEGEAKSKEDRKIISGILWRRMVLKIPLQVDATFKYINGKGTSELSLDDLKINSPYNTYVNLGLPKGPINNPGKETIDASLNPIKTEYLYFLTGNDGKMYYSKTFEEHKIKKQKYLR